MLPLIDMMMKAGGGEAMQAMARQFGLSQQQTMAAMEALMPAFSVGLKRNVQDPMGMGAFMQALGTGSHANYFDNVSKAFDPSGIQDGNNILGHLFGSKDVSRAVAQQAAAATGIGTEILKQMLPALASMVMGGLAKQTMGNMQAAAGMGGGNVFGDVITDMMKQYTGQRRAEPQPDASANPWGKMIEDMFGGGAQQQQRQQNPLGDNPLGKIFEEMTKGMQGGQRQQEQPQQRQQNPMQDNPFGKMLEEMFGGGSRGQAQQQEEVPQEARRPTRQNPLNDVFDEMFDTGRKQQETYQRGVESIFDQYLRGMDRSR